MCTRHIFSLSYEVEMVMLVSKENVYGTHSMV